MDAISFVVGVRTGFLRSNVLKQLIFNADDVDIEEQQRTASVKLVLEMPNGEEMEFERKISYTGSSVYKIDNTTTSYSNYMKSLLAIGINAKAKNFLVFQVICRMLLFDPFDKLYFIIPGLYRIDCF